ncbi:hypothetical protein OHA72_20880 [Dactylosporangium sp. NBC_01737]|uniref:hypothetical protein n=1 Tax=Dactylosporangium sp. NBC_01737 TaxID=2975959 RepID=UPI002E13E23F|nr:hypothetical protein OHA72_20880 [Dactylosporangium sp. NBC_01737]
MEITQPSPGVYVAVLDAPVTPADLTELAGSLPADAALTDVEQDGGHLLMTWEVHRVTVD